MPCVPWPRSSTCRLSVLPKLQHSTQCITANPLASTLFKSARRLRACSAVPTTSSTPARRTLGLLPARRRRTSSSPSSRSSAWAPASTPPCSRSATTTSRTSLLRPPRSCSTISVRARSSRSGRRPTVATARGRSARPR
eukprot:Amastigsp_a719_593.p3 type:complete len:139 gc:universal Amastigsp_a719_593:279-695(+)